LSSIKILEERSICADLERERQEQGKSAITGVSTDPEDAIATTRFIGCLRQRRERAGSTSPNDRGSIRRL
jgi:hypothetical protein